MAGSGYVHVRVWQQWKIRAYSCPDRPWMQDRPRASRKKDRGDDRFHSTMQYLSSTVLYNLHLPSKTTTQINSEDLGVYGVAGNRSDKNEKLLPTSFTEQYSFHCAAMCRSRTLVYLENSHGKNEFCVARTCAMRNYVLAQWTRQTSLNVEVLPITEHIQCRITAADLRVDATKWRNITMSTGIVKWNRSIPCCTHRLVKSIKKLATMRKEIICNLGISYGISLWWMPCLNPIRFDRTQGLRKTIAV